MVRRDRQSVQHTGPSSFWRARDFYIQYNQLDTLFVIVTILLCMLVATTYQLDMTRAIMAIVFTTFMVGAISIRGWMLGEEEERREEIRDLEPYRWMNIISWGLVGFIGITIAQFSVLVTLNFEYLSTLDFYGRAFGFIAATAEEWFFRGMLLRWLTKMTGEYVISSLIDSAVFTLYHWTVYVILLASTAALWAVFVSSLILCAVCIITRTLTSPTISHAMINVGLRVMI